VFLWHRGRVNPMPSLIYTPGQGSTTSGPLRLLLLLLLTVHTFTSKDLYTNVSVNFIQVSPELHSSRTQTSVNWCFPLCYNVKSTILKLTTYEKSYNKPHRTYEENEAQHSSSLSVTHSKNRVLVKMIAQFLSMLNS
jgi:hypothetical protein